MVAPDSKLLKPRNINRFVLLLGFLAPLVYLFGTQFFALAGAHGEEVLASRQENIMSGDISLINNSWISILDGVDLHLSNYVCSTALPLPNDDFLIVCNVSGDLSSYRYTRVYFYSDDSYLGYSEGSGNPATIESFSDATSIRFGVAQGSDLSLHYDISFYSDSPSYVYGDSLFGSMFNEDNFLAQLGKESLKDNPRGFAPYGSLIRFLDDSVFHMSDNALALMGYGYVYYCGHVVLLDLIALVLLFIPRLIAMVLEYVTKGVDSR